MQVRYFHLPYWYTIFYEHYRTGEPVIKPLTMNFPSDENVLDIDNEWLVGDNILVRPVTEEGAGQISVYLPGGNNQFWYDVENTLLYRGNGNVNLDVDLSSNIYFYRGGSIVPRRDTVRSSSVYTHEDPYTLYVFLDDNNEARGTLYADDTASFNYQNKEYLYYEFTYTNNNLSSRKIDKDANYDGSLNIGNALVYRPPSAIRTAKLHMHSNRTRNLTVTYGPEDMYLKIENINLDLHESFTIELL